MSRPAISVRAPAKVNLTLEVLGRRADGYHELRSVMTTVTLADELSVGSGAGFVMAAATDDAEGLLMPVPGALNTVERAVAVLAVRLREREHLSPLSPEAALRFGLERAGVRLAKRIPVAAGLGGGSSDAAATLIALNRYWSLGLEQLELQQLAAALGSDCPFFIRGGVQLASGRGELLRPLPSPARLWLCLLRPPLHLERKTARLYELLGPGDYGDGARTVALTAKLEGGCGAQIDPEDLCNSFDAAAEHAFGGLTVYRTILAGLGAAAVHLCGAGPTLAGWFTDQQGCSRAASTLRSEGHAAWAVSAPA